MWTTKRICNTQRQWIKLKEGRLRGCILLKCQQFRTGVLNYSSLKTTRFKSTCSISWGKAEQMIMDMIATVNAEGVKIASGKDPKEQCDEKQHILKEKMKHLNLSFAACGFLGIYHLGAAAAFYRHGEKLLKVVKAFAGASAGSLAATVLLTAPEKIEDCKEFTYNFAEETRKLDFGAVTPGYDFMKRLRGGIESILPSDAHEIAGNRLYVSITNTKNGENYLVSNFASREDLIKVLLASSFVPIYAGIKAVEYKGEKWIDGGLTNGLPILPVGRTVTISPFSGRLDICPQDKGHVALYVKVAKQDLMLSVDNLIRLNQALFPPSQKKMESLFQNGFDDAVHFLLKENWFE
ncbi:patatin-like phospholipase domain-containing protein 4 isoform X1 [Alligator mississippiensis]|uniref:patatin-like phospholipase domain-containing protein 4 isoform X1 n=1 Tax=Alligator mississippiensis TaxID=8496 RepID=UPI0003D0BAEC|nr:patatin-like phospholipase domain-containing protein 4 isoform X1 [Alligator mississippiensis]XP_014458213.1 patatin-like phospholipase domain-containing protein 4 isoform X1 [Alligator mississippiensis]XP_019350670.1 patatin-like phospholipase domain-containing protein 4 isoform X1 [Alligator mississippiensis]